VGVRAIKPSTCCRPIYTASAGVRWRRQSAVACPNNITATYIIEISAIIIVDHRLT